MTGSLGDRLRADREVDTSEESNDDDLSIPQENELVNADSEIRKGREEALRCAQATTPRIGSLVPSREHSHQEVNPIHIQSNQYPL